MIKVYVSMKIIKCEILLLKSNHLHDIVKYVALNK